MDYIYICVELMKDRNGAGKRRRIQKEVLGSAEESGETGKIESMGGKEREEDHQRAEAPPL